MHQLDQFKLYDLGAKLAALFDLRHHGRVADMFGPLTDAQKTLDALIKGDPITLKYAKTDASKLLAQLGNLFDKYFIDQTNRQFRFPTGEEKMDAQDMALARLALQKFERSLAAELSGGGAYVACRYGIYGTTELVETAHQAVPECLLPVLPANAKAELDAAGRAIGFGLGTASAMHVLRALELVTARYYEIYAALPASKTERNMATYLRKLSAMADDEDGRTRPDARLVQLLVQIKERYRNPMVQAETIIEPGTAATLFGLAISAITQIAEQIQAREQQPPKLREAASSQATRDDEETDDAEEIYDFRMSQVG